MRAQRAARWLWLLTLTFAVRVAAQPAALVVQHPLLPPFDAWYSGVVPYRWLLASQFLILGVLIWTCWRFATGSVVPRHRLGLVLLAFGSVYFAAMSFRLVLGLTFLDSHRWFASPLPTVFHLVLASFLVLCGRFHIAADHPPKP